MRWHIYATFYTATFCGDVIVPLSVDMRHYVLASRIPPVFAEGAYLHCVDVCHYLMSALAGVIYREMRRQTPDQ